MLSAFPPIHAIEIQAKGFGSGNGFGVVEQQINEKTYVIAIGGKQLTVETAPGALNAGERVYVTAHGTTCDIEPMPGLKNDEPDSADLFLPQNGRIAADVPRLSDPALSSRPIPDLVAGRVFMAPKVLPEGLFTFATIEGATGFLGLASGSSLQENKGPPGSDMIFVRTYPGGDGQETPARFFQPNSVPQEIVSWKATFSSRFFKSMPAEVFDQLLRNSGEVNLSQLFELDRMVPDAGIPFASTGMRNAQIDSMAHWLQVADASGAPPASIAALSPNFSARMLTRMLEELAGSLSEAIPTGGALAPEAVFPDAAELPDLIEKSDFLPALFSRLGFNLENALSIDDFNTTESLKAHLLRLASGLDNQTSPGAAAHGSGDPASIGRQNPDGSREGNFFRQIDAVLTKLESLQLLARPVPAEHAEQQILVFPLKIDEEWTEVHLRLVTDKNSGKSRSAAGSHYTVFLNVAPSKLGAIQTRLDYRRGKTFSLSMEFEKNDACTWFSDRKEELQKSLFALGLPQPGITMGLAKKEKPERDGCGVSYPSQTLVDLKA